MTKNVDLSTRLTRVPHAPIVAIPGPAYAEQRAAMQAAPVEHRDLIVPTDHHEVDVGDEGVDGLAIGLVSFIGYLPAADPEISILVSLDDPSGAAARAEARSV